MTSLKEKTVKGVFWSSIDRFSSQGIQFIFSILIARMLLPSDYGVIAMLGIFLAVSQSFIDSGFGTALVQKNRPYRNRFLNGILFQHTGCLLLLWTTLDHFTVHSLLLRHSLAGISNQSSGTHPHIQCPRRYTKRQAHHCH